MADAGAKRKRSAWRWIAALVAVFLVAILVAGEFTIKRASPILKSRILETLQARFNSRVELDALDVSLVQGLAVTGKGLRIYAPDDVVAAGATSPLVAMDNFRFHAPLRALWERPMHVGTVYVGGLQIHIPPSEVRAQGAAKRPRHAAARILVDEIVVENSDLILDTARPNKDPKRFVLQRIVLNDVGPNRPWQYDATLVNAIPRGDIRAHGYFGPWNNEKPGESLVKGSYTFDHADLNTIKGIGGMLSSVGTFHGQLNRIVADGTTKTPDFSLDSANRRMPLETTFHAIIDGTSGDTYLQPVHATLGSSRFTCSGAVINVKGKGHITELDVDVPNGRLHDFLLLAVKTQPPVMQSNISMKVHLRIPYGKESVTRKLEMNGAFTLRAIHFTNPKVQAKVNDLSERAQGHPQDAVVDAPDVLSSIRGQIVSRNGQLNFPRLLYTLPGGEVNLQGVYSMDGKEFEFHGKVRTDATLSQMVVSKWKRLLLKAVDPFFRKNGAGAEIPVKISGTQDEPHFGLDFHQDDSTERRQRMSRGR